MMYHSQELDQKYDPLNRVLKRIDEWVKLRNILGRRRNW